MVADALSQKSSSNLACMVAHLRVQPMENDKVKVAQSLDPQI